MITESLFETVLIDPAKQSADTLYIVSGYASATMASKHLHHLKKLNKEVRIELIVGMAVQDGISEKDHNAFNDLASGAFKNLFVCRYVAYAPPVHTKTYSWFSNDVPRVGFSGSANYTQQAFSSGRREALIQHDAAQARAYFELVMQDTVDCADPQVPSLLTIFSEPQYSLRSRAEDGEPFREEEAQEPPVPNAMLALPHVKVSLLNRRGEVSARSSLNWGQRPGREPNQAYIPLTMPIIRSGFFPQRREHFTIFTDDDKTLICVRAQDEGKGIESPQNNSIVGLYFRHRLGLPEGSPITKEHLDRYGRADIDFYKIDEETYFMDFSL